MENGAHESESGTVAEAAREYDDAKHDVGVRREALAIAQIAFDGAVKREAEAKQKVAAALGWAKPEAKQPATKIPGGDAGKVLAVLACPMSIRAMATATQLPYDSVTSYLGDLKKRGLVRRVSAGVWTRV